ncbi:MAG: hemin uptake protein HemP [Betaproteobacteria bacterium HGW-Betaproteobacteria-12]|nr:MAG: hemin uptake protein HemP [Betaproteobacteria bacterium HGW-Betaproteobacteria-12]
MTDTPKPAPLAPPAEPSTLPARVDSGQILRGASTVEIEHAGQRYLLRVTRENKLILTK